MSRILKLTLFYWLISFTIHAQLVLERSTNADKKRELSSYRPYRLSGYFEHENGITKFSYTGLISKIGIDSIHVEAQVMEERWSKGKERSHTRSTMTEPVHFVIAKKDVRTIYLRTQKRHRISRLISVVLYVSSATTLINSLLESDQSQGLRVVAGLQFVTATIFHLFAKPRSFKVSRMDRVSTWLLH